MTKAEPKKKARMEEVLEKCIKPFLLGKSDDQLYLVKLGKEKIDYEQELRIQAEKERKKRDKIAKQYADNLVLAMGRRACLSRLLWLYRDPDSRRTQVGKNSFW